MVAWAAAWEPVAAWAAADCQFHCCYEGRIFPAFCFSWGRLVRFELVRYYRTMSVAEKISITLTPEMNRMIKQRVEAGDYGSTSELIREALRVWQKRDEEHHERIAEIRSRIKASVADSRPSFSLEESRADFLAHVTSRRKSAS